jgi:hypothetical protein
MDCLIKVHDLHPFLSHRSTAAQFLGALARVALGEPPSFGVAHPGGVMMLWL